MKDVGFITLIVAVVLTVGVWEFAQSLVARWAPDEARQDWRTDVTRYAFYLVVLIAIAGALLLMAHSNPCDGCDTRPY